MSDTSRTLRIVIAGDPSGSVAAARQTEGALSKLGVTTERVHRGIVRGASVVGAAFVAGAGYAADAASDLNEILSFTEVTFGDSAAGVEAWGETTLEAMGLAKASALEAANGFGGLFKTTGATTDEAAALSEQMVQLAVDMSSAKNVDLADALDALKSGLIGESEPMRRFNVLLSEATVKEEAYRSGIAKRGAELTESQKVQARMNVVLRQTSDIQGDYARTADSAANQQRKAGEAAKQLAAEIGQSLLPVIVESLGHLNEFISLWEEAAKTSERVKESGEASANAIRGWALAVKEGTLSAEDFNSRVNDLADSTGTFEGKLYVAAFAERALNSTTGDLIEQLRDAGFAFGRTSEEVEATGEDFKKAEKKVVSFAHLTGKELREWTSEVRGDLRDVGGTFGALSDDAQKSAEKIVKAFRDREKDLAAFKDNVEILLKRGLSETVLKELVDDFDSGGAEMAAALVKGGKGAVKAVNDAQKGIDKASGAVKDILQGHGADSMQGWKAGLDAGRSAVVGSVEETARQMAEAARVKLGIQSPSKVFHEIGRETVEGLIEGLESQEDGLEKFQDRIRGLIDDAKSEISSFRDSVRSGFDSFGDLSEWFGDFQEWSGADPTSAHISNFLSEQIGDARRFAQLLRKARKLGLNPKTLAELAAQGPAAIPILEALIEGGSGLIHEVNQAEKVIDRIAGHTAKDVTPEKWLSKLDRLTDHFKDAADELRNIARELRELGKLDPDNPAPKKFGDGGKANKRLVYDQSEEVQLHFHGNVYGMDDFNDQVLRAVSKARNRRVGI